MIFVGMGSHNKIDLRNTPFYQVAENRFSCRSGAGIDKCKDVYKRQGVAGLQAVATAKRLGAVVSAVDIRPDAAEHAKSLGAKIIDTGVPAEVATGEGGYARHLPQEWLLKEREAIAETVAGSDIIVSMALVPGKLAPILLTEKMVQAMTPGSAIVDVAIDQGGNCELTVGGEIIEKYGVSIEGTKNIPGLVPASSTPVSYTHLDVYKRQFPNGTIHG